jgi:hypothetical protein
MFIIVASLTIIIINNRNMFYSTGPCCQYFFVNDSVKIAYSACLSLVILSFIVLYLRSRLQPTRVQHQVLY